MFKRRTATIARTTNVFIVLNETQISGNAMSEKEIDKSQRALQQNIVKLFEMENLNACMFE